MTETTQDSWKHKVPSMLLAQVTAYVLLVAATVIPTPGATPIIPMIVVALVLAAFIASWPFRGTMLDRVTTVVFGVISLVFVVVPFPSGGIAPQHIAVDGKIPGWYSWALVVGLLLVVLVVFSFGRQMARENRSHLIRSLSHAATSGVASIAVAGWCFLPDLGTMISRNTTVGAIAVIVLVVLAAALVVASILWARDSDPDPNASHPWIGIGLLPVMLMGVTIAATTLVIMPLVS